ncbi:MAG: metallophosphoesterase [Eubacterium sp.]|nr:metallophosphoesterase [Eubacterium sp.]
MNFTVVVILIYIILILYALIRTYMRMKRITGRKPVRAAVLLVLALLSAMPLLGAFLPDCRIKYFFMAAGNIWFGFFVVFCAYLIVTDLLLLIRLKFSRRSRADLLPNRKSCLTVLCGAAVFSLVLNFIGNFHLSSITPVYYSTSVDKGIGNQIRIVLAADLHLSVNSTPDSTRKIVEKINEQDADLVVIAGDLFTSTYDGLQNPQAYIKELQQIRSEYGVYFVYGNHDVKEDLFIGFSVSSPETAIRDERMTQFIEDCGFIILEDEYVRLPGKITLAGRMDPSRPGIPGMQIKTPDELLSGCDRSDLIIVAEHEPDDYRELAEAGADIVLSGHIHNGQVFPGDLILSKIKENSYGYKELYGMKTYVTAGAGFFGPPVRAGTDRDIFVIDVTY